MKRLTLIWALALLLAFIGLLACALGLLASPASAFPANTREGYASCAACHVAETGGGTLTRYGRGAGSSLMATWAGDSALADPLYGLGAKIPDWLMLGGDVRAVDYVRTPPTTRRWIPMQQAFELAVAPPNNPGLTLDAQVGRFGPTGALEYRRLFAKVDLSPNVGVRVGHFIPSYGINVDDHTTVTRAALGLGEGQETWNAEAYWLAPGGEVEVTGIAGSQLAVDLNSQRPGAYQTDTATGWAARAALYVGDAAQVGLSAMDVSTFEAEQVCGGVYVQTGLGPEAFLLAEIDRADLAGTYETVAMARGGRELVRGLMATLQVETVDTSPSARAGLQWIPVPHLELRGELGRSWPAGQIPQNSALVLLHHWI